MRSRVTSAVAAVGLAWFISTTGVTASAGENRDDIILPASGRVETTVISKNAGDTLGYVLQSPRHRTICTDCQPGDGARLGGFPHGTELVFVLVDHTLDGVLRFRSTDMDHARIERITETSWELHWDDSGGCSPPCSDGDFNDLITEVRLVKPHLGA
jgi:hypothetical protein